MALRNLEDLDLFTGSLPKGERVKGAEVLIGTPNGVIQASGLPPNTLANTMKCQPGSVQKVGGSGSLHVAAS